MKACAPLLACCFRGREGGGRGGRGGFALVGWGKESAYSSTAVQQLSVSPLPHFCWKWVGGVVTGLGAVLLCFGYIHWSTDCVDAPEFQLSFARDTA